MTHVLDRWCSEGGWIECEGLFISANLAIDLPVMHPKGILPLGTRRIGEAMNPGPPINRVNIASINPTLIVNKQEEFAILAKTHDVHIIAAAETTATLERHPLVALLVNMDIIPFGLPQCCLNAFVLMEKQAEEVGQGVLHYFQDFHVEEAGTNFHSHGIHQLE